MIIVLSFLQTSRTTWQLNIHDVPPVFVPKPEVKYVH